MVPSRPHVWSRAAAAAPLVVVLALGAAPPQEAPPPPAQRLAAIEAQIGGRLGLAVLDTGSGRRIEYHAGDRFAMCSTFKLMLVAAVLARVDTQQESLDRRVAYGPPDLLEYAPVTREHVTEGGMTVSALCAASVELSDNTAANLLLRAIGGPEGLTRYALTLGDDVTRFDRMEPELNINTPGDPRDTTTPAAMVADLKKLFLGDALSGASRTQLKAWLSGSKTGAARLRAGFPPTWGAGDKTGTGNNGATNDVAIAWPPERPPVLAAVYLSGSSATLAERERALAEVGRVIATDTKGWAE
jgi:beta-lactamase class A